eukprot:TRINITY_DN13788_c0_g1_i3.p1 TRINITY_DN13788_c0_g1~~TRINITY_DN13788_c0_g1_i3.p1  ORF type:complete len:359 (+),score=105.10 TRINITY_DN13788_c0_g1_i3:48-1124(+)
MARSSFRGLLCAGPKEVPKLMAYNSMSELPKQDPGATVLIRSAYSTINYKDAMVLKGMKGVAQFPVVPGIDVSGTVVESEDELFKPGDEVIVTGNKIGQSVDGGMAEYCKVQAGWCVKCPPGITMWDSMAIGSAGITAMMCVAHLEEAGALHRWKGTDVPILVTGAGGGLGGISIALLSSLGYRVTASTRRKDQLEGYLKSLGADNVIGGLEPAKGPLGKQLWGGAIDAVGGETLAAILTQMKYRCAVASTGVAGGGDLPTSVYPFILRGVRLLGVDSTMPWNCPGYEEDEESWIRYREERMMLWQRLAASLPMDKLKQIVEATIKLEDVTGEVADRVIKGQVKGRYVVDVHGTGSKL